MVLVVDRLTRGEFERLQAALRDHLLLVSCLLFVAILVLLRRLRRWRHQTLQYLLLLMRFLALWADVAIVGGRKLLFLGLLVEQALEILTWSCVVLWDDPSELVPIRVLLRQQQEGLREVNVLIDVYVLQLLVAGVALNLLVFRRRNFRLELLLAL